MVSARQIQVRQVPGDFNALGRIKFMFPNQHSVYLHDTPTKKLFQRDYRALSHGCVRVQNPLDFADAILPLAAPDWNSTRLEKLYGGKERSVKFDTPIPVHLAYFTASVGAGRRASGASKTSTATTPRSTEHAGRTNAHCPDFATICRLAPQFRHSPLFNSGLIKLRDDRPR